MEHPLDGDLKPTAHEPSLSEKGLEEDARLRFHKDTIFSPIDSACCPCLPGIGAEIGRERERSIGRD
jgi:hypothetical protein